MDERAVRRIRIAHTGDLQDTKFSVEFINTFDKEWNNTVRKFQRKPKLNKRCNT